ncbi:UbiA family prenyltransferase [Sphingomonas sp. 35-24ZXX]|uniref:UbiA family prenyltransferase n=1 Tax=Sphingomonas sp. 35-24ZXX TaxID=1545915 RepID=UPI00053BE29D|nr:UbiA family prenyltransferase [Sphingomonas sp. 35-24ZXX]
MSIANWNPAKLTLVVDLDDTLISTDTLLENFWLAWSVQWRTPIEALKTLAKGKLALKQKLHDISAIDPARLPYNPDVLDVITQWRSRGGRVALVTGATQQMADAVAEHLGIFDAAHGSCDGINLTGAKKAQFLDATFGPAGYSYIGDAPADLAIWQGAAGAITLNSSKAFQARVETLVADAIHLPARKAAVSDYLEAMRPHQWLKNVLVFLPMLAAHRLDLVTALQAVLGFVAFSLVASATYILNDLLDLSADRAHPRKCQRPFASGRIRLIHGTWMIPALAILGALVALAGGLELFAVLVAYTMLTVLYSVKLKRLAMIDICALATLYTLRILAGSAATGVPSSLWLLAFATFFFFSLAAVKRYAELVDGVASGRAMATGRGYHVDDRSIVANIMVSSGLISILVLALYANSEPVQKLYHYPEFLWGVCLVLLYWTNRVALLTHRGEMHDDPVVFAMRDRTSLCCVMIVGLLALAGAVA